MTDTSTDVTEIRKGHDMDVDKLTSYLMKEIPGFSGPIGIKQFGFGQSNPTFLLTDSNGQQYVLRKQPPGKLVSKTAHRVDREYRVMSALAQTDAPVPKTYCYCDNNDIIGKPFYIMEFVKGRVFQNVLLPEVPKEERAAYWYEAMATMARLHNVNYKEVGLDTFGRESGYFSRQVKTFSGINDAQLAVADTVPKIPHFDDAAKVLTSNMPPESACVITGDFKMDNVIFHPTLPKILAIIDWEMSTIGHYGADLANTVSPFFAPKPEKEGGFAGLSHLDFKSLGLPLPEELLQHYFAHRKGVSYPDPYKNYYLGFYWWKTGVIIQGIAARFAAGQASSARAEEVGKMTPQLGHLAWSVLKTLSGNDNTSSSSSAKL